MAEAFARWIDRERGIGGVISAGGSGGTSLATAGMRRLPVGVPKLMVSTVASGQVAPYVGASDIMMLYSVADVQGLNPITERVLGNAANALGRHDRRPRPRRRRWRRSAGARGPPSASPCSASPRPPCRASRERLEADYDCLVFHATGTGGRSMESLADSGLLSAFLDLTTTEVADMLVGGVFPADRDRFGAAIRTRLPCVLSVGAMDMVNFGPRDSVPEKFRNRRFVVHNPNVTLMRTTRDENRAIGEWMGERHQPDAGARSPAVAGGRRLGARRARPAVPRPRSRRGAVRGAGDDRARRRRSAASSACRANINDDSFRRRASSPPFTAIAPNAKRSA